MSRAETALPLRPARDGDAQDLFGLVTLCFAEYPGCYTDPHGDMPDLVAPGRWKSRVIAGPDGATRPAGGEFWVLEDEGGRVCACVALDFPEAGVAELHRLYVRPDRRRRGLAAALTAHVEAEARAAGAKRIRLWSDTRFTDAHRLYERMGYRREGEARALGDISNSSEFGFAKPLAG